MLGIQSQKNHDLTNFESKLVHAGINTRILSISDIMEIAFVLNPYLNSIIYAINLKFN